MPTRMSVPANTIEVGDLVYATGEFILYDHNVGAAGALITEIGEEQTRDDAGTVTGRQLLFVFGDLALPVGFDERVERAFRDL